MTYQENSDNFTTHEVTDVTTESVDHTTEVDGFVRALEASASEETTVTLSVGGEDVANYIGASISKGEFGEPITEVGADEVVEVSVTEGVETAINLVVDEYKG